MLHLKIKLSLACYSIFIISRFKASRLPRRTRLKAKVTFSISFLSPVVIFCLLANKRVHGESARVTFINRGEIRDRSQA